jgi:hypothetical protein
VVEAVQAEAEAGPLMRANHFSELETSAVWQQVSPRAATQGGYLLPPPPRAVRRKPPLEGRVGRCGRRVVGSARHLLPPPLEPAGARTTL